MTTPAHRPLPLPNADNKAWWEGLKDHRLLVQRCGACGQFRHPPRPMCPSCRSLDREWVRSSGRGAVYSFTIIRHPTHPFFAERVPYDVVLVEMEEGVRIVGNMVDCPLEELRVGLPVEVTFEDVSEDIALPRFLRREPKVV